MIVGRFGKKFEFVHFEDAAFPSRRGLHSHDQCIEAAKQADIVVCIIDRRYGGTYHGARPADFPPQEVKFKATLRGGQKTITEIVPTKELSICWCELIAAYGLGKYIITFARQRTLDEKATRRKNQDVKNFRAAHVDNLRVFELLDWIAKQPKDNWIIPFRTAPGLLSKLSKWLETAQQSVVVQPTTVRQVRPVTVIVEGVIDTQTIHRLVSHLKPTRAVNVIAGGGKRALLNNLGQLAKAYAESEDTVVILDADTDDPTQIDTQRLQFREKARRLGLSRVHPIFTKPDLKEWFHAADPAQNEMPSEAWVKAHPQRGGQGRRIGYLAKHLQEARLRSESLDEFLKILEKA